MTENEFAIAMRETYEYEKESAIDHDKVRLEREVRALRETLHRLEHLGIKPGDKIE